MIKKIGYIFNRKEKFKLVFLTIIIVIGSFLELLSISLFSPFIELIMNPASVNESAIMSYVMQIFSLRNIESFLAILAVIIMAIYIVKNVFIIWEKNVIYKFAYGIQRKLSAALLKAYMHEPYTFHLKKNISELQRSMQEDSGQFANGMLHFMEMIAEVCVCIVLGIYLYIVSKSITIIIVGLLIVCLGIFSLLNKKYSRTWGLEGQESKAKIYQWMNQAIGGIKEIKVLNREEIFVSNYDYFHAKYVRVLRLNRLIGVMPKYIIEMVSMVGMLAAVIIKMYFGQKELQDFVPQLATFAVAAFRLLPATGRINEHMSAVIYASPSVDLIYHDLKEVEELEYSDAKVNTSWHFTKEIIVKHVSYRYPDGDTNVIEDASFTISKGQTVAFIGASGAGKSTMVDIILGLLSPTLGKIMADEMDIYKNLPTWQKEIGYIPQTIYLSDDTIRNNIAFGIEEDKIDEEAVIRVLKQAQLYEFVDSLSEGLDTFVGDRGVRLSGGQRQRIGIARALYHDPQILVLDEATSALDTDTETAVMEAIDHFKGEKTIIIIAHRLTTIKNADVVYEVADGKVKRQH
ncbi:MAG: ABC transporter ATP-binding protein/permease [Lachnospiraceae bacterium]|nr:ABC transporter ATP-binding protein/permease [Lachnospiraceae bacterium]MDD7628510.1 ABC transporter ATP-binding protein [Lachnospiraceae bacterium]MDY4120036.1 ABC transporter ATP-binding protein [Lachnospiraceae bacterium]